MEYFVVAFLFYIAIVAHTVRIKYATKLEIHSL